MKRAMQRLSTYYHHTVADELQRRFSHALARKSYDENDVDAARAYIQAMLTGFVLEQAQRVLV